ncbi:MAG: SDR family oxidoreductase [bacterium]|nr:SDR family oxidoreductase [bacterium]
MNNLASKNILVFAATGAIGAGAARKFAQEGAHVWISGRDAKRLDDLASEIRANGGVATPDVVDATDSDAVQAYVDAVALKAGRIDGVFNAIGGRPVDLRYPMPSTTQSLDDFMVPIQRIVGSQFLTSRAVGAQMIKQGTGGAIVILSATLSGMTAPFMAGITAANGGVEALARSLAGEFGGFGIRVNVVRGSGMPETRTIQETVSGQVELTGNPPKMTLPPLGRPISVAETVATASFLMSDEASGMTGQVVTVCAGAFV